VVAVGEDATKEKLEVELLDLCFCYCHCAHCLAETDGAAEGPLKSCLSKNISVGTVANSLRA